MLEHIKNQIEQVTKSIALSEAEVRCPNSETDILDRAKHNDDKSMAEARIKRDKTRLVLLNKALVKAKNDEYGDCEECGDTIPEGRLAFNPAITNCVECATLLQIKNKHVA